MKDLSKPVYIRSNMDVPIEELMEELDESWYYVWLCKEVADDPNLSQRGTGPRKDYQLKPEMEDFLANLNDNLTRKRQKRKFNKKFKDSKVTPMASHTLMKYKKRIRSHQKRQEKARVKNE